jgi:serine phosphatase RsbU (regulator of sigma subunit)
LEPAGNIAGDTFDFSLERDTLHVSMTDAMGHSVQAAVLATVLVGARRNARRARVDLAEQARLASASVAEHFHRNEYVTGQLVRVDLQTATAQIVNAGHPPPLGLRAGHVTTVALEPDLPFGWGEHEYRLQPLALAPGDRLVFLTDGLLERNASSLDIEALIAQAAQMHPRQAVQHLIKAVLTRNGGPPDRRHRRRIDLAEGFRRHETRMGRKASQTDAEPRRGRTHRGLVLQASLRGGCAVRSDAGT